MHVLAGLLALAIGIYFFFIRARNAAHIADEVADMAQTAVGAARRFGFRRRANVAESPGSSPDDVSYFLKIAACSTFTRGKHDAPRRCRIATARRVFSTALMEIDRRLRIEGA